MSEAEPASLSVDIRPFVRTGSDGRILHGLKGTVQIPQGIKLSSEQTQLATMFVSAARYACAGTDEAVSLSSKPVARQALEDWRLLVTHLVAEQLPLIEKTVGPVRWSLSDEPLSTGATESPRAVTFDPETGTSTFCVHFKTLAESLAFLEPIADAMPIDDN